MATKRIENLVKSVSNRLQPVLEFDRFYAALYNPIKSLVEFPRVTQDGRPTEWDSRPYQPTTWLPDSIIQTKTSRLVEQNLEQELKDGGLEYWPEGDPPKSWLAVPMIVENRAIGVIVVENRRKPRAFGENGLRVLSSVARQTAQAVENARLVERLNALYRMGPELSSRIRLGELAISQLIYEQASELMDTSNLYVALYNSATDIVRFPLMYVDGRSTQVESRSGGKGRTELIIRKREPIFIETRIESEAWYTVPGREEYIGEPLSSWVGVPMIARDEVLGVIATYHKTQDYVYTKDDQEILSLMANQAAVALENARLYEDLEEIVDERTEELQKRTQDLEVLTWQLQERTQELETLTQQLQRRNEQLAALQRIGTEVALELKLEDVLSSIVKHTNSLLEADFSTLFPYYVERGEFGIGIRKGKVILEPSIPSKTGYSGRLALSQRAVFVEDAENEPGVKPTFIENKKIKSFAGIPLLSKGKTAGVLYVNYLEHHRFSEEEQNVIRLLANQAAVAIENARLYAEMEKQVEERTRQLNEKVQELEKAQSEIADKERTLVLTSVAADFVHKMNNLAGTIPNWVALAKRQLNPTLERDMRVVSYLEKISQDAKVILQEARRLRIHCQNRSTSMWESSAGSIVAQMELIASPDIEMTFQAESLPGYVQAVKQQLSDALFNIVDNGVKSIVGQGRLSVEVQRDPDRPEQFIRIDISDTGSGIPSDKLDKIFELGTTYRPESGGMGYGLWRARNIVEGIDGEIAARSELGKGSTFSVWLPVTTLEEITDSEVV